MELLKGIVIILDGLGDRPATALGGRTPLEAAATPNLDALARRGLCGLLHPLAPWVPVGTQTGVGLLMGLPPADVGQLNRGPVEAAGVGVALKSGDVALRCNFATLRRDGAGFGIVDRRAGRVQRHRDALADAVDGLRLDGAITTRFVPTTGHRAVLVLSGAHLSGSISDTDPGAGYKEQGLLRCEPLDTPPEEAAAAARTAGAVNAFIRRSYDVLTDHPANRERERENLLPANGILTRGAGQVGPLRNQLAHLGLRVAVVTGERTAMGLARLYGFDVVTEPAFTAGPDTDLDAKVRAVQDALGEHDLVYLHIKAPDVLAHDGDRNGKRAFIERADAALEPLLTSEHVVVVTGDHSSDAELGRHVGDPVPVGLAAPRSRTDAVEAFGETACLAGGLGQLSAADLLHALLDHMNRLPNYRPHDFLLV